TGFTLLLLPYSVIGPYVGVFLDRWSRRSIIVGTNALRALFVVPSVAFIWTGAENLGFIVLALLIIGLNRFFLAGLSAAVPHVAGRRGAAYALLAQSASRALFGVLALATLLLFRQYFHHGQDVTGSISGLGMVFVAGSLGVLVAAFATPPVTRRVGGWRWV